jgi:cell fate (sporulation/competence/biofilm development) regulator YmcA (YheA/YmcA/DUF963 family)
MGCCSSSNSDAAVNERDQAVNLAVDQLSSLLEQTKEFQEFARLARLINLDPDVKRIQLEFRDNQIKNGADRESTFERLQSELEDLPAVQAYRQAEAAVKDLIQSVDEVVSQAVGIPFAVNAKISGCG